MIALTVSDSGYQLSSNYVCPCTTTKSSYLFLVGNLFTPNGNYVVKYPKTMSTAIFLLSGWNSNPVPINPDERLETKMQDQRKLNVVQGGK